MLYAQLAALYDSLAATPKRLHKMSLLSAFLRTVPAAELEHVMHLLQGRVFPQWDQRTLGFSAQLALKTLVRTSGQSQERVVQRWKELGDLGKVAASFSSSGKQTMLVSAPLTTQHVYANLRKLASVEGEGMVGTKVSILAQLLADASGVEAQYLIRTVLEDLRIGLGEGTLRDALVWAFEAATLDLTYDAEKNDLVVPDRAAYDAMVARYQHAYDMCNDFGRVAAVAAAEGSEGLSRIKLTTGTPVKVMLFQKAKSMADALEAVGKKQAETEDASGDDASGDDAFCPVAIEDKYDGFRIQIHKSPEGIRLYTRRLEEVTTQFPDVVEVVAKHCRGERFILDAEAAGIDKSSGKYLAFQNISQRIKRKYDIEELRQRFPVEVNVFDVLQDGDANLVGAPFSERRAAIERIVPSMPGVLQPSRQRIVDTVEEAQRFYEESLARGNEGVMVKSLSSPYEPGSRVGTGVKVKPTLATLEVVIVGAEYGEGKRGEWLATFVIAVRDAASDELMEIGRVGTGFKEKDEEGISFRQMTQMLLPLVTSEDGRFVHVKPQVIIEVDYEEIQASPTYSSGYALRFPRFVRLREDRGVQDISTIDDVEQYYRQQRGRGA